MEVGRSNVTMFDILEPVVDPEEITKLVRNILKKDGDCCMVNFIFDTVLYRRYFLKRGALKSGQEPVTDQLVFIPSSLWEDIRFFGPKYFDTGVLDGIMGHTSKGDIYNLKGVPLINIPFYINFRNDTRDYSPLVIDGVVFKNVHLFMVNIPVSRQLQYYATTPARVNTWIDQMIEANHLQEWLGNGATNPTLPYSSLVEDVIMVLVELHKRNYPLDEFINLKKFYSDPRLYPYIAEDMKDKVKVFFTSDYTSAGSATDYPGIKEGDIVCYREADKYFYKDAIFLWDGERFTRTKDSITEWKFVLKYGIDYYDVPWVSNIRIPEKSTIRTTKYGENLGKGPWFISFQKKTLLPKPNFIDDKEVDYDIDYEFRKVRNLLPYMSHNKKIVRDWVLTMDSELNKWLRIKSKFKTLPPRMLLSLCGAILKYKPIYGPLINKILIDMA